MPQAAVEISAATVEILRTAVEISAAMVDIPGITAEILTATVEIPHMAVEKLSATVDTLQIAVENPAAQAPAWAQSMTMCRGRSAWTRRMLPVKNRLPHLADRRAIRLLTQKCMQIPR